MPTLSFFRCGWGRLKRAFWMRPFPPGTSCGAGDHRSGGAFQRPAHHSRGTGTGRRLPAPVSSSVDHQLCQSRRHDYRSGAALYPVGAVYRPVQRAHRHGNGPGQDAAGGKAPAAHRFCRSQPHGLWPGYFSGRRKHPRPGAGHAGRRGRRPDHAEHRGHPLVQELLRGLGAIPCPYHATTCKRTRCWPMP